MKSRGFSIVEVMIVVGIIGILATIVAISYTAIQTNTRDSEREAKATIIAEALEKYYNNHGEYPSCSALTSSLDLTRATLDSISPEVLRTPSAAEGVLNSITCVALTPSSVDAFAYVGDGTTACSGSESCSEWTLQYLKESTGEVLSIESRNRIAP